MTSLIQGLVRPNVTDTREGNGVRGCCQEYYEGYSSSGPCKEEPDSEHDDNEAASDAGFAGLRFEFLPIDLIHFFSFSKCFNPARGLNQGEEVH